jgi:four helix bundle protein
LRDFTKLAVWTRAHELTLHIYEYELTSRFPREELYGLTSHLRRAADSIPSNIAEGCGREGDAELARFRCIFMGSASEVEYQLLLAKDLRYLHVDDHEATKAWLFEVKKMQNRLLQRLTATRRPDLGPRAKGQEPGADP